MIHYIVEWFVCSILDEEDLTMSKYKMCIIGKK